MDAPLPTPPNPTTDAAQRDGDIVLLLRAGQGGPAFDALVQRYERKVYRLCMALLRDESRAEDAAQDVFLRAWRALANYDDGQAALSTWLYAITRNCCLSLLARQAPECASLSVPEVWAEADLLLKVKEPIAAEYHRLRKDQTLFTYLHLAASHDCTEALLTSGTTAIAYETVQTADGRLPLLAPMSEVAGRLSAQVGAYHLMHSHGGRVYVDGANMNALVGVAAPGEFGGDVSHLNLHKTFCIPHGGGGPGVGPVCVVEDLVPYLPGHATAGVKVNGVGAVSAAPLGNAAVLPITWMYIRMMGADGLQHATEAAILAANYISKRLAPHYPTLYAGDNGHVAHECILDLRHFKDFCGVMAEDVAKRLMDYGFHAPTLSFPVANTLMVEPTESETLEELDRFIDAMIAIREEIRQVENGTWPQDNNPLKNAPHTADSLMAADWDRAYPREVGGALKGRVPGSVKYWPPVGRVDNVYGDRNLFCSCIPLSEYA